MTKQRIIGIMGAMPQEIDGILSLITNPVETEIGMRKYISGTINGTQCVVVFSRWGKVAAAMTAATLITKFEVTEIIFTGVAGAISKDLKMGDIVIASSLIQHDMDGSPLTAKYELPLLGKTYIDSCPKQLLRAQQAVTKLIEPENFTSKFPPHILKPFNIVRPSLYIGLIASGDQFFSTDIQKETLQKNLPNVLCVEMEGAAVAQVCFENGIPFSVIRVISDGAASHAAMDFTAFVNNISCVYIKEIIKDFFTLL